MTAQDGERATAWSQWRTRLAAVGASARAQQPAVLELSTGHPGGIAQLLSGRVTRLSNLIRDEKNYVRAARIARQIEHKAAELSQDRGLDAVQLLAGEMLWHDGARSQRLPVILQPAIIQGVPGDFELKITSVPVINPEVVRQLSRRFNADIDVAGLQELAHSTDGFHPDEALRRLSQEFRLVEGLEFARALRLGMFSSAPQELSARAVDRIHPLLDAVIDVPGARSALAENVRLVTVNSADERSALSDALILDASAEQENIVAQASTGTSFVVRSVPGAGVVQAVANIVATLVPMGRRIAIVAPSRASLDAVADKLRSRGLGGLAVSPASLRRDLISAINRNEHAQPVTDREQRAAGYARLRDALLGYRRSLQAVHPSYGVSVSQALSELARLSLLPDAPQTRVRLHSSVLEALAIDRSSAANLLRQAADLGQFDFGPEDSPWYGATFHSPQDAENMYLLAKRLSETDLRTMVRKVWAVFDEAGLREPQTLTEINEGLQLLLSVRDTLDRFHPVVYDRSLEELIAATAPRRDQEMASGARRRLRQLAKEYLRPGAHVSDVHVALQQIQRDRQLWQRLARSHQPPSVPTGLGDANIVFTAVAADLKVLALPLDSAQAGDVNTQSLDQLQTLLDQLTRDVSALGHLHERAELLAALERMGLAELVEDFSRRHVTAERAGDELELAWWQSVLELLLERDGSLLNANTQVLARLERDFVLEDRRILEDHARELAATLAQRWTDAVDVYPNEAKVLREQLLDGTISAETLIQHLPHVGRAVAPVWLFSPYQYGGEVPERAHFDTVILLDAASITLTEAVLPIAQAEQVIAIGDPVLGAPTGFSIDAADASLRPVVDEPSAFRALADLLPQLRLDFSYQPGGRALAALVNRRWYDQAIHSLPSAAEFVGEPALTTIDLEVHGRQQPNPDSGTVEAMPAEVTRVVELVIAHAVWRPDESLMVVSASALTAHRIRAAVRAEVLKHPQVAEFFDTRRHDPFVVLTIAQAATRRRDRVIFSLGYGRTPHGRLLSEFGPIRADDTGWRWLGIALTRARRHLTVVAALGARDEEVRRLEGAPRALLDLLGGAREPEPERTYFSAQALLVDLGRRLQRKGLTVDDHFDDQLGLTVTDGITKMVIETDADYSRDTLRESLRLHPSLLTRMGWRFRRVYSFELFANPQHIADEIQGEFQQLARQHEQIEQQRRETAAEQGQ